MKSRHLVILTAYLVFAALAQAATGDEADRYWPQWRGPRATGVAPHGDPPVEWSETKNIRWKAALPGQGHSTPIVWGDRVYVQTAIPVESPVATETAPGGAEVEAQPREGRSGRRRGGPGREGRRDRGRRREAPTQLHKFVVMAFDRRTGERVWEHVVREEVPHEGSHQDGSLAPASPITDGERFLAYFGSRGLYCFDMKGTLLWQRDFGKMTTRRGFGEGSSAALADKMVVVNWDHEGDSFIVALDRDTGETRWRKPRDEVTSWSTPLVVRSRNRPQAIVTATNRVRSYDLQTGEVVWECGGLGVNCVPTPVAEPGLAFAMSGHREPALLAIRYAGASGDLTGSQAVRWTLDGGTPYVPSPLLYDGMLYFVEKNSARLGCYDARSGRSYYTKQRLEGLDGVYGSLVGAQGRVYVVGKGGVTKVVKLGKTYEALATNELDDHFAASPAIAGGELYLRGWKHLYCIAER